MTPRAARPARALLALAGLLCFGAPALAQRPRSLEFAVEAVWALPRGDYEIEGFVFEGGDLVSNGSGLLGQALYRLGERWGLGLSVGAYRAGGGQLFDLLDVDADLIAVPLHAIGRFRLGGPRLSLSLEPGLGLTHFDLDASGLLQYPGGEFDLDELDRTETNASILAGASIDWAFAGRWSLGVGARYHHTFTVDLSENAVKFLLFSAGLRYSGP